MFVGIGYSGAPTSFIQVVFSEYGSCVRMSFTGNGHPIPAPILQGSLPWKQVHQGDCDIQSTWGTNANGNQSQGDPQGAKKAAMIF